MNRFMVIAILLVNLSVLAAQQPATPLRFDIASVKPNQRIASTASPGVSTFPAEGGFRANMTLQAMVSVAYELRSVDRVVGGPSWVTTQAFTVDARTAPTATRSQRLEMLRSLIEERFGLVGRRDSDGNEEVYALVLPNPQRLGPGLRRTEVACVKGGNGSPTAASLHPLRSGEPVPCGFWVVEGITTAANLPIQALAGAVGQSLGEEVIDRTGLSGNFDIYLQLPPRGLPVDQQQGGSILTAVQEQLGMKLQREEVPRELFVIEKVSELIPN